MLLPIVSMNKEKICIIGTLLQKELKKCTIKFLRLGKSLSKRELKSIIVADL